MFIFLVPLIVLAASYVAASDIAENNKTGFFVVMGIIVLAIALCIVLFGG